MRTVRFTPMLLATLCLGGCYNPQILDGGLKCGTSFECPEGYQCNRDNVLCYKEGTIAPTGGMGGGGTGGSSGMGGGGVGGTGGSGGMCMAQSGMYGPFTGCAAQTQSGCDVVCQAGCACNERCKLESGKAACRAEGPTFTQQYQDCEPRSDQCRPGAICLQESDDKPACGAHCYRHCRSDSDCTDAKCTIEVQFGADTTTHRVCSPPRDECNPWGTVGSPARCSPRTGRPFPTFGCYVMSGSFPDIAICDCAGTTPIGQECTYEHECEPGAECVLLGQMRLCRKVCKVGAIGGVVTGGCPGMQTCTAFPSGTTYGYCHN